MPSTLFNFFSLGVAAGVAYTVIGLLCLCAYDSRVGGDTHFWQRSLIGCVLAWCAWPAVLTVSVIGYRLRARRERGRRAF